MKSNLYPHVYKFWLLSLLQQYGNFKEAGNAAKITQSALSQNLTLLESILGITLVIRGRGSIELTDEGARFLEKVNPILTALDHLSLKQKSSQLKQTRIRLGAYESMTIDLFPQLLSDLRQRFPDLRVDVRTGRSAELSKLVRRGEIDLALVIGAEKDTRLQTETVAHDELGLFVSAHHPIKKMGVDAIRRCGIGTIASGTTGHPGYYQRFVKTIPDQSKTVITSDSFETIRSLTASGMLVGLLPLSVGFRNYGELIKVFPLSGPKRTKGSHSVDLLNRKNIDPELRRVILTETRKNLEDRR